MPPASSRRQGRKVLTSRSQTCFICPERWPRLTAQAERITSIYSDMALRRVWGAARMSWWLTMLLHRFPAETAFEEQMRVNQLDYLQASEHAQASLAEQCVGLPFEA